MIAIKVVDRIKTEILKDADKNIRLILEQLGCEHIKDKGKYFTSTRPTGDNKTSVVVFKDTLVASCYTAGIIDKDIIVLVEEFKGIYFTKALYWLCQLFGVEYYDNDLDDEPKCSIDDWNWMNRLLGKKTEEKVLLQPISESILNRFKHLPHEKFVLDGVSAKTQKEFGICFNISDEYIIMPIYDDLGNLVGTKGRATRPEDEADWKFISHYKYPKTKILYGLYKTYPYIKEKKEVILTEAEKGVQQLWSMGDYKNSVGIGSKTPSSTQIEMIKRLGASVVIAFDKDVTGEHITKIVNQLKLFCDVYVIWDKWCLLSEKESPMDNPEKWAFLYAHKIKA